MTLHVSHPAPKTTHHRPLPVGAAVEFLLAHAVSNPSESAVMAAVRNGRTGVLSELMRKGLGVNLEMLLCAIHAGQTPALTLLKNAWSGERVDLSDYDVDRAPIAMLKTVDGLWRQTFGKSAFVRVAASGNVEKLEWLYSTRCGVASSALSSAVERNDFDMVMAILKMKRVRTSGVEISTSIVAEKLHRCMMTIEHNMVVDGDGNDSDATEIAGDDFEYALREHDGEVLSLLRRQMSHGSVFTATMKMARGVWNTHRTLVEAVLKRYLFPNNAIEISVIAWGDTSMYRLFSKCSPTNNFHRERKLSAALISKNMELVKLVHERYPICSNKLVNLWDSEKDSENDPVTSGDDPDNFDLELWRYALHCERDQHGSLTVESGEKRAQAAWANMRFAFKMERLVTWWGQKAWGREGGHIQQSLKRSWCESFDQIAH